MKLTPKFALLSLVVIWILACLPFFIPRLNSLEPHILGLPFIACYILAVIALHVILLFVCKNHIWDTFDKGEEGKEDE